MAASASLGLTLTMIEEIPATNTGLAASAAQRQVTHNAFNVTAALSGSTTPPASLAVSFVQALTAGSATIDLTAMPGTNGATKSGSGLKVVAALFAAPDTNANPITISEGASNGYELLGDGWSVTLKPGQSLLWYGVAQAPTVGGAAKTIDLAGTGSQVLNCALLLG